MRVDSKKVVGRRILRFRTPADARADAESLAALDHAGQLRQLGNWTLGQALGHCAAWIGYAYEGYPAGFRLPPLPIRWVARLMIRGFIRKPMPVGFRMRGTTDGTFGTEVLPTVIGQDRFRVQWVRLEKFPPEKPNPIFGPLEHDDWVAMHLRHAELHLSFFVPR
ncbi:MAG: DUF1569 domain-containing protein [Phycisphaerae bacterium]|nr:DUF1569 domain-containing protein [Phycisphaerae bacterium]